MDKQANDTFAFDLDNRLDDFFNDTSPQQDDGPPAPDTDTRLKGLKSSLLAIDWEITNEAMDDFIHQVDELSAQFFGNKIKRTLLKLLKSLGTYIRAQKSNAHPDAIKRIMAVYSAFEECVVNESLSENEKEKLLVAEVKHFKRLKAQIKGTKTTAPASNTAKPQSFEKLPGLEEVIQAIGNLKSMITAELGSIRKELEQLRNK